MAYSCKYKPRPITDIFTADTDINRRACKRTVPMKVLILGLGPFVGSLLWGRLGDAYRTAEGIDFSKLFLMPAAVGILAALVLLVGFRPARPAPAAARAA